MKQPKLNKIINLVINAVIMFYFSYLTIYFYLLTYTLPIFSLFFFICIGIILYVTTILL